MCSPDAKAFSNAAVLICIDPRDPPQSGYDEHSGILVDWIKTSRRRPGHDEILVPGEPENRSRAASATIALDPGMLAALRQIADRVGADEPAWSDDAVND